VTGGRGTRTLDPDLDAAGMDEYTRGVDLGLSRDTTVRFTVVRKLDWGGRKELDLAMPYEAYTDVRTAVDPGRDNAAGTADDGVVPVWSVPRSYPTFEQVVRFTTNTDPGEGQDKYWGFETTMSKRYSNGWALLGSVDRRDVRNIKPRNPNEAA
jgi:hypothetical protein